MARLAANLWWLALLTAGTRPVEPLFEVPSAAPSFTGLLSLRDCVLSVSLEGQARCVDERGATRWKASVGRPVTVAPVLIGEVVMIASATSEHGLAQDDGREVWQLPHSPGRSALASSGDQGYALARDGGVTAIGPGNEPRWAADAEPSALLAATPGALLVASSTAVTSLAAATGERRWSTPLLGAKALVASAAVVLVSPAAGGLQALEPDSGRLRWSAAQVRPGSPLTLSGDVVWAQTAGQTLVALSQRDGREVQRVELGAPLSGPVTVGDEVLVAPLDGREGCAVLISRARSAVTARQCVDHQLKGSPVVRGEVLWLGPRDGRVLGYRLNRAKGAGRPP